MSWTVFIIAMMASMFLSGLIARLLTRGPAAPPPLAEPPETRGAALGAPDGWAEEAAGARSGKRRGTLAMPALAEPTAARAEGAAPLDREAHGGRRRGTLQTNAHASCPRHPERKATWTCRFCREDYCVDCRLQVDDIICCPSPDCRAQATRFAEARRSQG